MSTYRVKDWSTFQHFKDRKPPWIKLYRTLLDDLDWHNLDPKSAKILVMLWLIASESECDGTLPCVKTLAFRLRMTEKAISDALSSLSHYLIQDDIGVISEGNQDDSAEREREAELKAEKEREFLSWFDACWISFEKYGRKSKAMSYARAYKKVDRERISEAIPAYIKCVHAGRPKKQFEGWVNPANKLWDMDWSTVLAELTKKPGYDPSRAHIDLEDGDAAAKSWE